MLVLSSLFHIDLLQLQVEVSRGYHVWHSASNRESLKQLHELFESCNIQPKSLSACIRFWVV